MNSQTPDDVPEQDPDQGRETGPQGLLSAYLDGELTAGEAEAVEAHLESSEESRQLLQELRSLSTYLTALEPEPAPEALRSTLLTSHPTTQPATRSNRGRLIAAAVAVAALVMAVVIPQMSPWSSSSSDGDDTGLVALSQTPLESEPSKSADPNADAASSDSAEGLAVAGGGKLVFDKTPDRAEVGQILSAIDTSDGQAVVVRLTVVDIQQGLDSLRLLLQKHQIAPVDAGDKFAKRDADRTAPGAGLESTGGQLVSVVVQASPEQVSKAMASLRREVVSEVELAGVLHVAALQTAPGGRQALAQLQSYGSKTLPSPTARAARRLRSSPVKNRRQVQAGSDVSLQKSPALTSAQVRLDLPANLMKRVNQARTNARSSVAPKDQGRRQLQVVFVLVSARQPASPPPSDPDGAA